MSAQLFICVPTEIRQLFARYLDLIDLYSLLKTCKSWRQIIDEDLGFQKICLTNTPLSLRYHNRQVTRLFQTNRARRGIKNNDAAYFVFYVPNGSCHQVAEMLIATDGSTLSVFRDRLLEEIKNSDADKVLAYLLECCPPDLSKDFNAVVSIVCNVFLKEDEIEADRNKKTLHLVLQFLKKCRDIILCALIEETSGNWSYSNLSAAEFARRLFRYQKKFPDYVYDLDAPYEDDDNTPYKMNPMAQTVVNGNEGMFDLLVEFGAKVDPKQPHLSLLYYHFGLGQVSFRNKLYSMGVDLSVPLPTNMQTYHQSILHHVVDHSANDWVTEHLLFKGAKLLPEEEAKFLAKPEDSPEHEVAVRQQTKDPYDLTEHLAEIPPFERVFGFSNHLNGTLLVLLGDGRFELKTAHHKTFKRGTKYKGQYRIEGSKIVVNADTRVEFCGGNSYSGPSYDDFALNDIITARFLVVNNALNKLAVLHDDDDDQISAEEKINLMMVVAPQSILQSYV